jgi:hypothetical protein
MGRVVMFMVCKLTWSECSEVVALEASVRSCCISGDGAADVPDAPEVAPDDVAAEVPDEPEVWEVAVEDLCPHPAIAATSAAANTIATTGVEGRRETRRWEICACDIKPFMASLC